MGNSKSKKLKISQETSSVETNNTRGSISQLKTEISEVTVPDFSVKSKVNAGFQDSEDVEEIADSASNASTVEVLGNTQSKNKQETKGKDIYM